MASKLRTSPLAAFKAFHDSKLALRTGYSSTFRKPIPARRNEGGCEFRSACRDGTHTSPTSGFAPGFIQTNVVMLQQRYAFDFLRFCLKNPLFCPLLTVTEPGQTDLAPVAVDSDIRTDIPKYRVYRSGEAQGDVADIRDLWSDDMVTFLLGCSFSWEDVLADAGLPPRHMLQGRNVPMFRTNLRSNDEGPFGSTLVVSMRPYRPEQLEAVQGITEQYPGAHGGPVHWGNPEDIGIETAKLGAPDWGEAVSIEDDEVPVFWPCGVSSQTAVIDAKLPLVITHSPGYMFVTDIYNSELRVGSGMPNDWH